ncbi:MAG: hypothetical protein K0Q94_2760 [Paenibacillus sp.]|jgi:hypothetical protein|uniref:hypothetical protein n=1 Tax=unclassified Paenibacillus TaxID=185978 RepID=UPI0029EEB8C4|nr:hypothetical protein [Paenibacillus sp.]
MQDKKRLYILLSDTGTWFSRLIKSYTKEPFNHASLAFDAELRDVFSFGRKYESNPFLGGFVKENIRSPLFLDEQRNTTCAVYVCEVSPEAYERIRESVLELEKRGDDYKYNALGLLGVVFNIKLNRDNAYFCSQFVSEMFRAGGVSLVPKCPEFTTPGDLGSSEHVRLIYTGSLRDYASLKDWGEVAADSPEWIPAG